ASDFVRFRELVLPVVADDLLFDRVRPAAQDSSLGGSRVSRDRQKVSRLDAALSQNSDERASPLVVSHGADRHGDAAQVAAVGGGVSGAARQTLLLPESQDEDRRLSTHPFGMTKDETIENIVAGHDQPAAFEGGDEREQPLPRNAPRHQDGPVRRVFKPSG